MNVSEYLAKQLIKSKIDTVFSVTGGGSMFLVNALGKDKKLKNFYLHHEQSCTMAADVYGRIKKKPAIVCVTTGPGGINAINGVFGAYTDSVPMIILSGQVKTATSMVIQKKRNLRQLGDQENDIIYMVKKITKKTLLVKSQNDLLKNFDKLITLSSSGRPGPIWIDIPIDIQGEELNR
ncbi:thiamine pyrophosphate-binding protein [Candidatus Pelagibacter sp. Uisw_136]|jgi:acetolactate synthase-1/2/3 large subunit|uniref:thiamine pyrophosphate-binding protein n=1 Tax=Candidatus Pelagibacter sp. Uisw_136 TaxID=3230991 RepID=UPI0039E9DB16